MGLNIFKNHIRRAQIFKLFSAIILPVLAFLTMVYECDVWVRLTRPYALCYMLDYLMILSMTIFIVMSSLPLTIRFRNSKKTISNLILCSTIIAMSSSLIYLTVETINYISIIDFFDNFGIWELAQILRFCFFSLLFLKEFFNRNVRAILILTGVIYLVLNFCMFYNEKSIPSIKTLLLCLVVVAITLIESYFHDLKAYYMFSGFNNREYIVINDEDQPNKITPIDFAYVISFEYRGDCLQLLLYSDEGYYDVYYKPFDKSFLCAKITADYGTEFLSIAQIHTWDRQDDAKVRL